MVKMKISKGKRYAVLLLKTSFLFFKDYLFSVIIFKNLIS